MYSVCMYVYVRYFPSIPLQPLQHLERARNVLIRHKRAPTAHPRRLLAIWISRCKKTRPRWHHALCTEAWNTTAFPAVYRIRSHTPPKTKNTHLHDTWCHWIRQGKSALNGVSSATRATKTTMQQSPTAQLPTPPTEAAKLQRLPVIPWTTTTTTGTSGTTTIATTETTRSTLTMTIPRQWLQPPRPQRQQPPALGLTRHHRTTPTPRSAAIMATTTRILIGLVSQPRATEGITVRPRWEQTIRGRRILPPSALMPIRTHWAVILPILSMGHTQLLYKASRLPQQASMYADIYISLPTHTHSIPSPPK